ncbi:MAG: DUF1080 domain-containing protein [Pirellulaceae bacterium]
MLRVLVCCALLLPVCDARAEADGEEGFQSLFDGKTLDGWEGDPATFRVESGAIVGGSLKDRIPHNAFLCTRKKFGNFELRFKSRLVGQGNNAGVQFRSERIPDHFEVRGYQCDMGDAFGRSVWGALYDESRRRKMLAEGPQDKIQQVFRPGQWNDMVVRCEGNRVQIWLNGLQTVDYTEMDSQIARDGVIGLQIHGGEPAEASYKDLRIKELP